MAKTKPGYNPKLTSWKRQPLSELARDGRSIFNPAQRAGAYRAWKKACREAAGVLPNDVPHSLAFRGR